MKQLFMENRIEIKERDVVINQNISQLRRLEKFHNDVSRTDSLKDMLAAEGCVDFIYYIAWLGLDKDPNPVILSSMHHYFFDSEELKNVNTVINLKELNHIKQTRSFLNSIYNVLPLRSYLVGCFIDNRKNKEYEMRSSISPIRYKRRNDEIENGIVSKNPYLNMLFSMIDSRTNKYMTRGSTTLLLEQSNFKVLDMTELNGLTYFCTEKAKSTGN